MNEKVLTPEQLEKRRTYQRNYYHTRGREKRRTNRLYVSHNKKANIKRKYGLTLDQMQQMYVSQGGLCAICKDKFKDKKDMNIDHNHTTGQVRQILCYLCNSLIGFAKEDVSRLEKAIDYINFWISK